MVQSVKKLRGWPRLGNIHTRSEQVPLQPTSYCGHEGSRLPWDTYVITRQYLIHITKDANFGNIWSRKAVRMQVVFEGHNSDLPSDWVAQTGRLHCVGHYEFRQPAV